MEHFVRPSEGIIGYTAGLLDGEGTIAWSETPQKGTRGAGGRFVVNITQGVANDGDNLTRWLRDTWQLGTTSVQEPEGFSGRRHHQYYWHVGARREVYHLLTTCMPYLRVKRQRAEDCIAYIQTRIDTRTVWTAAEDIFLLDHNDEDPSKLAARLQRTPAAIRHRRKRLQQNQRGRSSRAIGQLYRPL